MSSCVMSSSVIEPRSIEKALKALTTKKNH